MSYDFAVACRKAKPHARYHGGYRSMPFWEIRSHASAHYRGYGTTVESAWANLRKLAITLS